MKRKPRHTLDITCGSSSRIPFFFSVHLTWRTGELGEEKVIVRYQVFLAAQIGRVRGHPQPHSQPHTEEWDILPNPSASEKNYDLTNSVPGNSVLELHGTADKSLVAVHTAPRTSCTVMLKPRGHALHSHARAQRLHHSPPRNPHPHSHCRGHHHGVEA